MGRVLPFVLAGALWIYGVIDCAQTPRQKMPVGLSKPVWLAITLLVPAVGSLAWLLISRLAQADGGTKLPRRRPKGPSAPDDDPEFLANLDWQARKAHYQRQKAQREQAARDEAAAKAAAASAAAATSEPIIPVDGSAAVPPPDGLGGAAAGAVPEGAPADASPADAVGASPDSAGESAGPAGAGAGTPDDGAPDGGAATGAAPQTPESRAPRSIEEELAALEAQFRDDPEADGPEH